MKPRIVISRCLGFGRCRWNGIELDWRLPSGLNGKIDPLPVCPECEIGLGVPRPPIRIVRNACNLALVQPQTGRDLSCRMEDFNRNFLAGLGRVDGFILKSRSPSCGINDVPVYADSTASSPITDANGPGFFARAVLRTFPALPVCDERQLADPTAARRWLQKIGG